MDLSKLNHPYYKDFLKVLFGHLNSAKYAKDTSELLEILKSEIEKSKSEGVRSTILPTTTSYKEGKNFFLKKKDIFLSEDEIRELIDDFTGVYIKLGGYVYLLKIKDEELEKIYKSIVILRDINLESEKIRENYMKKALEYLGLSDKLYKGFVSDYSHIILFLMLNHFIMTLISSKKEDITLELLGLDINELNSDINKPINAVFTVLSRNKKKKYYLNDLTRFIKIYYIRELSIALKDTRISSKFNYIDLNRSTVGSFVFSFYIPDKDYKDKSAGLLDKFLYYLVFKNKINFEILSKMILLLYEYIDKSKKYLTIRSAGDFYLMMNVDAIYNWALYIGINIINASKENGREYIEEIIKEIRKEEMPGRFFSSLSSAIYEVVEKIKKETGKIDFNLSINNKLFSEEYKGDSFYMVKSAILSGLINSLSIDKSRENDDDRKEGQNQ
ncbi:MAG: hypothetical protein ACP5G1_01880 [Nanopusillaceae archaeon]